MKSPNKLVASLLVGMLTVGSVFSAEYTDGDMSYFNSILNSVDDNWNEITDQPDVQFMSDAAEQGAEYLVPDAPDVLAKSVAQVAEGFAPDALVAPLVQSLAEEGAIDMSEVMDMSEILDIVEQAEGLVPDASVVLESVEHVAENLAPEGVMDTMSEVLDIVEQSADIVEQGAEGLGPEGAIGTMGLPSDVAVPGVIGGALAGLANVCNKVANSAVVEKASKLCGSAKQNPGKTAALIGVGGALAYVGYKYWQGRSNQNDVAIIIEDMNKQQVIAFLKGLSNDFSNTRKNAGYGEFNVKLFALKDAQDFVANCLEQAEKPETDVDQARFLALKAIAHMLDNCHKWQEWPAENVASKEEDSNAEVAPSRFQQARGAVGTGCNYVADAVGRHPYATTALTTGVLGGSALAYGKGYTIKDLKNLGTAGWNTARRYVTAENAKQLLNAGWSKVPAQTGRMIAAEVAGAATAVGSAVVAKRALTTKSPTKLFPKETVKRLTNVRLTKVEAIEGLALSYAKACELAEQSKGMLPIFAETADSFKEEAVENDAVIYNVARLIFQLARDVQLDETTVEQARDYVNQANQALAEAIKAFQALSYSAEAEARVKEIQKAATEQTQRNLLQEEVDLLLEEEVEACLREIQEETIARRNREGLQTQRNLLQEEVDLLGEEAAIQMSLELAPVAHSSLQQDVANQRRFQEERAAFELEAAIRAQLEAAIRSASVSDEEAEAAAAVQEYEATEALIRQLQEEDAQAAQQLAAQQPVAPAHDAEAEVAIADDVVQRLIEEDAASEAYIAQFREEDAQAAQQLAAPQQPVEDTSGDEAYARQLSQEQESEAYARQLSQEQESEAYARQLSQEQESEAYARRLAAEPGNEQAAQQPAAPASAEEAEFDRVLQEAVRIAAEEEAQRRNNAPFIAVPQAPVIEVN